jgi:hypothetical protein
MDDANMEALREILQDMAQTIELISSGARSGNDLIFFLEEMLQTIEAWATKYNVAVDGIDHPDGGEAVDTGAFFHSKCSITASTVSCFLAFLTPSARSAVVMSWLL